METEIRSGKTEVVRVRVEPGLKQQVSEVLSELDLDFSTAIRMFLRQIVKTKGMPFDIRNPNKVTIAAMKEARDISKRNEGKTNE